MECPSCYEVYNEEDRIPRNLPCGHTYCEKCLNQIFSIKKRLDCPVCRIQLDPQVKAKSLSKNFVAAEIACKHREIQKKLSFCDEHKEPLRFFCETCQKNICPSCIVDHSGHKFVKQDHSVSLLKERTGELKAKVGKKLDDLGNIKVMTEKSRENLIATKEEQLKYIDEEFEKVIAKLNTRKNLLKKSYSDICQEELTTIDAEISKVDPQISSLKKALSELDKYIEKLGKTKIVQGDQLQKELNDIEDVINKETKQNIAITTNPNIMMTKVIFDPTLYKTISVMGAISKRIMNSFCKNIKNLQICFFGEKSKILTYSIERGEWKVANNPFANHYEFNYYSSAVTLPGGNIMITGGGISNAVYQINLSSNPAGKINIEMIKRAGMKQARKEHASVLLQNSVYVLGGYDGGSNNFLYSCEKYDLETDEWKPVSPMNIAKCAFGATTVGNKYIFTVGGYDGHERLNKIEKYDVKEDKWTVMPVSLKQAISNSACFAYNDHSIVILGGGYNVGFCLEVALLDINTNEWKSLHPMSDGRDLRNKLVSVNGNVYAMGGNNFLAEKYSCKRNEWSLLSSYQHLVNDNLDSWACALHYEIPGAGKYSSIDIKNDSMVQGISQQMLNYQYYHYEGDPYYEDEVLDESQVFERDWQ